MLDRNKLNSIKRAVRRDDWPVVGALYLDLSLEAEMDRFHLESLAPLVRLRDGEKLTALVNETFKRRASARS